jgi:hypothetical protein
VPYEEPPWLKSTEEAPREPNRAAFTTRFLVLGRIDLTRADHHVTCRVELDRRGHSFTGEASELDTEPGRARAAAKATLRAAENASTGAHLALEGAVIAEVFGRRYVIVSVEAAAARQFLRLSHIVALERSVEEAACLATLGAIERWLAV